MSIVGPFKLKLQLMCGPEPAMGPGKAMVLEAVARTGSISAAGRDLGMSYRRTWMLVDSLNRCWSTPLVETSKGGEANGGARLTPKGQEVLAAFRELEARLGACLDGEAAKTLREGLLDTPRPARTAQG